MSVKAVDEAVKKYLIDTYPNVVFSPRERRFEVSADSNDNVATELNSNSIIADYELSKDGRTEGESIESLPYTMKGNDISRVNNLVVKFPLIAFDRVNLRYSDLYNGNDAMRRTGLYCDIDNRLEKSFGADLYYQIDIISDRRVEVEDIWRELSMKLFVNNEVEVIYKTEGEEVPYKYAILIIDTASSKDVSSFFDTGVIYEQSITILIRGVRMIFSREEKLIEKIPVRYIVNKEVEEYGR